MNNCDCKDKQYLIFIEGYLTCLNCGAQQTPDDDLIKRLNEEK
jgi:hypothetical protein